jgi:lycopene beta-cyclase
MGAGLQTALILAAFAQTSHRPRITVISTRHSRTHTWSLHKSDLSQFMQQAVLPMVAHKFPSQMVSFPDHERSLDEEYWVMTSESIAAYMESLREKGNFEMIEGLIDSVEDQVVRFSDTSITSPLLFDNRGQDGPINQEAGWQKFVGLEVELSKSSPIKTPVIMDATVKQLDGYRFMYVLPLTETRVLVEDTYYSDNSTLDEPTLEKRVLDYCQTHQLDVKNIVRRESGVLLIPLTRLPKRAPVWSGPTGSIVFGGYRGEWYHRTTGYSFPIAAKLAETTAHFHNSAGLVACITKLWSEHRRQSRLNYLLNQFLFRHFSENQRWNALARFYRLPKSTIQRFYSDTMTGFDQFRIIAGRPQRGFQILPIKRSMTCQLSSI